VQIIPELNVDNAKEAKRLTKPRKASKPRANKIKQETALKAQQIPAQETLPKTNHGPDHADQHCHNLIRAMRTLNNPPARPTPAGPTAVIRPKAQAKRSALKDPHLANPHLPIAKPK